MEHTKKIEDTAVDREASIVECLLMGMMIDVQGGKVYRFTIREGLFFSENVHGVIVRYPLVDQVGKLLMVVAVVADGILKVGMGGFTRATYTGWHFFIVSKTK